MAIEQHASNLIDITAKAFNGDITNVSPIDASSLIDSWLDFLQNAPDHDHSLDATLSDLKKELQKGQLNGDTIEQLMSNLVNQVKQVADSADTDSKPKLTKLSEALDSFNQLVTGKAGPAPTGGQAPIASTVGGDSTNSGAGGSMLGSDDDELSNRTGGTVSNVTSNTSGETDEAPESPRSSDDTGDASYSKTNSTNSATSGRSDTSRIDGPGISGGTGDTATTQSGGRSQY
ncbi:hypothetical protein GCM10027592_08700 [Spirosoma flavus]